MRIGITTDNTGLESVVADEFANCSHLLIVSLNDSISCREIEVMGVTVLENPGDDSGAQLVQELIHYDCEAVITGKLEPAVFEMIADACITRYNGAGYQALNALGKMAGRELELIRNAEGTDGCDDTHHWH